MSICIFCDVYERSEEYIAHNEKINDLTIFIWLGSVIIYSQYKILKLTKLTARAKQRTFNKK